MKRIAIIPARSGSKGLKDKNILPICEKPMLAYSVEAAIKSGVFDRVILSTDSVAYGEIAKAYGAEVILRGECVSNDSASTFMVLEDLFQRIDLDFDYFMLLQPTSPMRTEAHIKEACALFEARMAEFDFLASIQKASHPAVLVRPVEADGSLKHFDIDYSNYKRQAYCDYTPNGAIYIAKPHQYLAQKHFYGKASLGYEMNAIDSADVDNAVDYELVCVLMRKRQNGEL